MLVAALLAFGGGAFVWSFAEYGLHNWYGHLCRGKNRFSREHLGHHAQTDYFAPTSQKIAVATLASLVIAPLGYFALGAVAGVAFTAGFLLAYTGYEILHRRIHVAAPLNAYGRWARRHHLHHHFSSPKKNHGVTSPLWDWVFRTYEKPAVIKVPARQPLPWLIDSTSGEVLPQYAGQYIRTRKGSKLAQQATA